MFFKIIALGKTQYYAIRVEFQVRGSPHIHSFIWILNAPKLTKVNIDDYRKWVDSVISLIHQTQIMSQNCLNLSKLIKYIVIQKLVVNIEIKSVGSVLLDFPQTKP